VKSITGECFYDPLPTTVKQHTHTYTHMHAHNARAPCAHTRTRFCMGQYRDPTMTNRVSLELEG